MRASLSIHIQAAEISRMEKMAFPTLADADQRAMALDYFTRASESESYQRHLLAVTPATMKKAVQDIQVLDKVRRRSARQQKGYFKCGGPHMQRDCPQNTKQPSTTVKTTAAGNWEGLAQA